MKQREYTVIKERRRVFFLGFSLFLSKKYVFWTGRDTENGSRLV